MVGTIAFHIYDKVVCEVYYTFFTVTIKGTSTSPDRQMADRDSGSVVMVGLL